MNRQVAVFDTEANVMSSSRSTTTAPLNQQPLCIEFPGGVEGTGQQILTRLDLWFLGNGWNPWMGDHTLLTIFDQNGEKPPDCPT